jgi:hypothetical protein
MQNRNIGHLIQQWVKLALPLALLVVAVSFMQAQTTASLSGLVTDTTGAVVPGAAVTAIDEATLSKTVTVSGGAGTYSFPVLLPGTYTVTVAAKGFQGAKATGIVLTAGMEAKAPTIALTVGAATETVTVVVAQGTILQTENGQLGGVLDASDLKNLALESQNTLELLKVLPGITSAPNGTGNGLGFDFFNTGAEGSPIGVGLATNGVPNRGGTADLLDGVNINDPGCNCWSIALILPDWVQEVSYQASNFGADVSHGPTVVSSISKSGSAQYHGQGYFYARNDVLNANDWVSNFNHTPRGTAHYYYPGGDVGGPIPFTRKKLLGWFGYEKFIQNTGNADTLTSHIPTSAMMGGDFTHSDAAGQALCQSGIGSTNGTYCDNLQGTFLPNGKQIGVDPGYPVGHIPTTYTAAGGYTPAQYAADLAKIWPSPNATPSLGNGFANFVQAVPGVHDGYTWRARLDYNISEATKLYVSYQYGYDSSPENGSGAHIYWTPGNSIPFPGGSMQALETSKILTGHLTHVFGTTLTNELVGSVGYGNNPVSVPNPSAVYRTTVGYPGGTVFGTNDKWIPSYNSPTAAGGGPGLTFPDFSQQDIFAGSDYPLLKEAPSVYDNVIKVLGRHTIKTGVFYEMINNDQGGFNTANGVYSFNGGPAANIDPTKGEIGSPNNPLANFVLGNATSYSENSANPRADEAYKTISVYGDDTWKVLKNFTFEYGVRFDHMGRWYDRGTAGIPVFSAARVQTDFNAGVQFPGLSYYGINPAVPKSGMTTPFLVLSPRIGLSYDVFGNGKTVARGGWGVYRWNDQYGDYSNGVGDAQGVKGYNLPGSTTVLVNQVGTGIKGLTPPSASATATCCAGKVYAVSASDSNNIPTTYMYNFTVDQQLPWQSVLEVAYVGNQSNNVLIGGGSSAVLSGGDYLNVNKMPLGALFNADPVTGVVAADPENINGPLSPNNQPADYMPFGYAYGTNQIYVVSHTGYSNYNGLQVTLQKRSDTMTFNVNYTHSKTLGTDLSENPYVLRGNYGVEPIDRPNVFNASYSYTTRFYRGGNPFVSGAANGWTISGITTWQGGGDMQALSSPNLGLSLKYVNIPASASANKVSASLSAATYYGTTAGITIQPTLSCDPGSGVSGKQHMKVSCFGVPKIGSYGARDFPYVAGPSYTDADLAISKSFHIIENQSVEFRASAFNWLNHPLAAFNGSDLGLTDNVDYTTKTATNTDASTFGYTETKTGGDTRRIIQLELKYNF